MPEVILREEMVLLGRIELPASPLPRECSTTELQQHIRLKASRAFQPEAALWRGALCLSRQGLRYSDKKAKEAFMADQKYSDSTAKAKAEQKAKLAEQLRANLRRRKAQSREMDSKDGG